MKECEVYCFMRMKLCALKKCILDKASRSGFSHFFNLGLQQEYLFREEDWLVKIYFS